MSNQPRRRMGGLGRFKGDNAIRIGSIRQRQRMFQRNFVTRTRASLPQIQVPLQLQFSDARHATLFGRDKAGETAARAYTDPDQSDILTPVLPAVETQATFER